MCDPTTLAVTSLAMAGTQSIVSYMGASQDAAAQTAMFNQNRKSAISAYQDDIDANNMDLMASQEAGTQRRLQAQADGLYGRAMARVSAGERGIGGLTAAALERDLGFAEGSSIASINRNAELDSERYRLSGRASNNAAQSRINSMSPGRAPSLLALGASLGASAVDAYKMRGDLIAQKKVA